MRQHFSIYFLRKLTDYVGMNLFFKVTFVLLILSASFSEARIRNRKVKEAPRVCGMMNEDKFLSRQNKKIYGTERHSLVIGDSVSLLKDKGEKICEWNLDSWKELPPISQFHFYIDEYKEMLYPYVKKEDGSVLVLKVPLSECSLQTQVTQEAFVQPRCEHPQKMSRNKKRRSIAKTNS